jgi:hypothetical protein
MTELQKLDLRFMAIDGRFLRHVSPDLKRLWLTGTLVNDETIGNCTRFSRLAHLEFLNTKVTAKGLMKLADLHWLTNIGAPREVSMEAREKFNVAKKASADASRAAGKDVPPVQDRANNRHQ